LQDRIINIGFSNYVAASKIVAIVGAESAPIRRLVTESRQKGTLINATQGHKARSAIITDSSHLILSSLQPEKVAKRFVKEEEN